MRTTRRVEPAPSSAGSVGGASARACAVGCLLLVGCNAIFGTDELRYDRAGPAPSTTTGSTTTTGGEGGNGSAGSCDDGVLGPKETDVDCGGGCPPCPNGNQCGEAADCQSHRCAAGWCAPCAAPDDCEPYEECVLPDGICQGRTPNGAACTSSAACASGFCPEDDLVCCDTPCVLPCEACLASKTGAPDGYCGFVDPSLHPDPDGECEATDPSLCGSDGSGCPGDATACRPWPNGTECAPASCSSSTARSARTCDGEGSCQPAVTTDCEAYQCSGSSCRTSCSAHSHCIGTFYCTGNICTARLVAGSSCSYNEQCLSELCDGGYCV